MICTKSSSTLPLMPSAPWPLSLSTARSSASARSSVSAIPARPQSSPADARMSSPSGASPSDTRLPPPAATVTSSTQSQSSYITSRSESQSTLYLLIKNNLYSSSAINTNISNYNNVNNNHDNQQKHKSKHVADNNSTKWQTERPRQRSRQHQQQDERESQAKTEDLNGEEARVEPATRPVLRQQESRQRRIKKHLPIIRLISRQPGEDENDNEDNGDGIHANTNAHSKSNLNETQEEYLSNFFDLLTVELKQYLRHKTHNADHQLDELLNRNPNSNQNPNQNGNKNENHKWNDDNVVDEYSSSNNNLNENGFDDFVKNNIFLNGTDVNDANKADVSGGGGGGDVGNDDVFTIVVNENAIKYNRTTTKMVLKFLLEHILRDVVLSKNIVNNGHSVDDNDNNNNHDNNVNNNKNNGDTNSIFNYRIMNKTCTRTKQSDAADDDSDGYEFILTPIKSRNVSGRGSGIGMGSAKLTDCIARRNQHASDNGKSIENISITDLSNSNLEVPQSFEVIAIFLIEIFGTVRALMWGAYGQFNIFISNIDWGLY